MIHRGGLCPFLFILFFLLAGCAQVGPDFRKPAVQVSGNWLEAGDPRVKTGPAEYKNWWQAFNDPVLNRLVDRAYQENLTLRMAGVRVLEARARLGIALGGLYPQTQQLFGSLEYIRTSERAPTAAFSNIFNYGRIENNVLVQDVRFQQLLIAYQEAVLKAQKEVEDVLVAFLKAQECREFLARSAAAAGHSLDLAIRQYQEGARDFTTVLIAQQAFLNEQDNLALALGTVSGNLVGIYRALGGGWEVGR